MICIDVQNNKRTVDNTLRDYPEKKTLARADKSDIKIHANDFDTYIFDAYIHEISLLPNKPASSILAFYEDLKKVNEAKYILQNKDLSLTRSSRLTWVKLLYDALDRATQNGKYILDELGNQDRRMSSENTTAQCKKEDIATGTLTTDFPWKIEEVTMSTASWTIEGMEDFTFLMINLDNNTPKP